MICPYCKTNLTDGAQFCPKCGQPIGQQEKQSSTSSSYWNTVEKEVARDDRIRVEAENKIISQRRRKRRTIVVSAFASLLCVASWIFFTLNSKREQYLEASKLFEDGEYSKAIEIYKELGNYENATAYLEECEAKIQEEKYLSGYDEYQKGNYKNALTIFESLGDYKNSQLLYEECWMLIMPDTNSPFEQDYWIIFTEGSRSDRVEASTIDSSLSGDSLFIIWDRQLNINDSSGSSQCNQFFLNADDVWEPIGDYHRLSDYASNIIASNLDVYDSNGNLILPKCSYENIDWEQIDKYR